MATKKASVPSTNVNILKAAVNEYSLENRLSELIVFIFQAEDGIRVFCLSRGLCVVYNRQDAMDKMTVIPRHYFLSSLIRKKIYWSNVFGRA